MSQRRRNVAPARSCPAGILSPGDREGGKWILGLSGRWSRPLPALAGGPEGLSIVTKPAEQRPSPRGAAEVTRLPGSRRFLASIAIWAGDVQAPGHCAALKTPEPKQHQRKADPNGQALRGHHVVDCAASGSRTMAISLAQMGLRAVKSSEFPLLPVPPPLADDQHCHKGQHAKRGRRQGDEEHPFQHDLRVRLKKYASHVRVHRAAWRSCQVPRHVLRCRW